ncbi:MAG: haloacid dehalogenase type II [Gammaproteobacteria bacterium]|nr:MAG: haloacid dehalogenase type II [Gammaproteobacteria bacterium]
MKLTDFKVLTFDCYGTLIDWEAGIWDALQPLLMANGRSDITRLAALESHAILEHKQEIETPGMLYTDLLTSVHRAFAAKFDLQSSVQLDSDFGNSVAHWPAFPDTADALRYLQTRFKLVILSNVSRAGFAASNRKLGVEFDAIYTAEDIGSYKPAAANFEYLFEKLSSDFGLARTDILHTAQSLFHDHVPAKKFGLANAWIDRRRLSESGDWGATAKVDERPDIDFLFFSMQEMAEAVKGEST